MEQKKKEWPSPRATRLGLLVAVPLAVLAGTRAIAWAEVQLSKVWNPSELLTSKDLNDNFAALKAAVDELQNQQAELQKQQAALVNPRCPSGYDDKGPIAGLEPTTALCQRGKDEVVKVGVGGSAFWIDRYEASVWAALDATGTPYGRLSDDFPTTFPKNGQYTAPLYALSVAGSLPSRWVSWFQASAACRAAGKRLPTDDEWLTAARGTPDPGSSVGTGGVCLTNNGELHPRVAGEGAKCASAWGAEDMIGNVWEWTATWHASPGYWNGTKSVALPDDAQPWTAEGSFDPGADYHNDGFSNISSGAFFHGEFRSNTPAATQRGGSRFNGIYAGVFAMRLNSAPAATYAYDGFRCVVPR